MDIHLDSDVAIGTQAVYPPSLFSENENFKRAAFIPAILGRMGWAYLTFLRAEIAPFHHHGLHGKLLITQILSV